MRVFEGSLNGANRESPRAMAALKQEAWEAVRASIEKRVPAIAWQPMTVEQRRDGTPAYDRFGYTDPVQWFCVLVIGDERPTERRAVEIESIRHAVDMARARDAANESLPNPLDARGLAAYDLWRTILEDEADTTAADRARAEFLSRSRDLAARYLGRPGGPARRGPRPQAGCRGLRR